MKSKHATLTAATVATQTLAVANADEIVVHFRSGTGPIYYTINGATPTVAGDDTFCVHPLMPARSHRTQTTSSVTVKLISATADKYTVEVDD